MQVDQVEAAVERDQSTLRDARLLPTLVGPIGSDQVPDGAQGPVRQGDR